MRIVIAGDWHEAAENKTDARGHILHGPHAGPVCQATLEYADRSGAHFFDIGDRLHFQPGSTAVAERERLERFCEETFAQVSPEKREHAHGNHDVAHLTTEELDECMGKKNPAYPVGNGDASVIVLNPVRRGEDENGAAIYENDLAQLDDYLTQAWGRVVVLAGHYGFYRDVYFKRQGRPPLTHNRNFYRVEGHYPEIRERLEARAAKNRGAYITLGGHLHVYDEYHEGRGHHYYIPSIVRDLNGVPGGVFAELEVGEGGDFKMEFKRLVLKRKGDAVSHANARIVTMRPDEMKALAAEP